MSHFGYLYIVISNKMNEYDSILEKIKLKDLPIKDAKYEEAVFGSWYIELDSNPSYRVVHDGRDKTIVLEINKNNEWVCLVSDKTKSGKHVLEKLMSELCL